MLPFRKHVLSPSLRRLRIPRALALFVLFSCFASLFGQSNNRVLLRIIVVDTLAKAQQIRQQVLSGADFADLARKESISQTASSGGVLGDMQPSDLRPELRDAVAALAPGQVTDPIKMPDGYAILQAVAETAAAAPGPDQSALPTTAYLPLAAQGSVKYTSGVSGYSQALLIRRKAFLSLPPSEQDEANACKTLTENVPEVEDHIHTWMNAENPPPEERGMGLYTLGQLYLSEGRFDQAFEAWNEVRQLAANNHLNIGPHIELVLGATYLYRASWNMKSDEGGVDASHLFPQKPGSAHPNQQDLAKAIQHLTEFLRQDPKNLEGRWLLNVAYMSAGTYPDKVPPPFLIPPDRLRSKENIGRFVDVSPSAGVNFPTMAGGLIVDDFDNDGLLDIVTSQVNDCAPLHFFHNNGDGTFSDRSVPSGLSKVFGGLNIIQADYNNDGCMDILVLRGGWEFPRHVSLLRNNCNGTFTDVTVQAGLGQVVTSTNSAVWTDIDNDGNLDLFLANENTPNQLFLNNGDGTFRDISHQAGVDKTLYAKGAVAADIDNDGFPDIYVSNFGGDNVLFHNNGNRTFTDIAKQAHVEQPRASFGAAFLDFDNDGFPDLFVTSYYTSVDEIARQFLGMQQNAEGTKLFRNRGDGTFEDVSARVGLDKPFMTMGFNYGDADNDGYLDLYLGSGDPSVVTRVPNFLLRNDGGKSFVDITDSSGTGAMEKGHGIAFADFTNSGHEDIAVVMGGAAPVDRHWFRLFRNPGNSNDWITVHLVGKKTNRCAIGAKIKVNVTSGGTTRAIWRTISSGGSFGADPLEQHIGLGHDATIASVEVFWPASKTHQTFTGLSVNQAIRIEEFSPNFTRLQRKTFSFRGTHNASLPLRAERRQ